jgi:hypothetical protein
MNSFDCKSEFRSYLNGYNKHHLEINVFIHYFTIVFASRDKQAADYVANKKIYYKEMAKLDSRVKSELEMKLDFFNFIIQKVKSNEEENRKEYRVISFNQIEFLHDRKNKTFIIPREEYFDLLHSVHKMNRTVLLCLK